MRRTTPPRHFLHQVLIAAPASLTVNITGSTTTSAALHTQPCPFWRRHTCGCRPHPPGSTQAPAVNGTTGSVVWGCTAIAHPPPAPYLCPWAYPESPTTLTAATTTHPLACSTPRHRHDTAASVIRQSINAASGMPWLTPPMGTQLPVRPRHTHAETSVHTTTNSKRERNSDQPRCTPPHTRRSCPSPPPLQGDQSALSCVGSAICGGDGRSPCAT